MILHTGLRTDIPAFYAEWLKNRIKEGFVLVRNPYCPDRISKYSLSPDVVDLLVFCTKNPAPMLPFLNCLKPYGQYWFVTITPYGKEIEPNVPPKEQALETFQKLSGIVGPKAIVWRYDPVFLTETYSVSRHLKEFEAMAKMLSGYTHTCVFSFLDLYPKVRLNFPEGKEVLDTDKLLLGTSFAEIGKTYGINVKSCGEGNELARCGVDTSGCMTVSAFEQALGKTLCAPKIRDARKECACFLTCDIGAYNSCGHLCRYCYANYNEKTVRKNLSMHDPNSPLLLGKLHSEDEIHSVNQKSWIDLQMRLGFL